MANATISQTDRDHALAYTRHVWADARRARIFLTGGTGFFGAWLSESFCYANEMLGLEAELVILTRDASAAIARAPRLAGMPNVTFHEGDVRDFTFPAGPFTHVVHGAAESSQQAHVGDHRHMFDTIVFGTRRTLEFARAVSAANYLLVSSGAVYGNQPSTLSHVPEDFSGAPSLAEARSAYGEGKRAAEVMAAVEAERGELSVRVARCFAFVGPHLPLDIHFAIGNFIRDAMNGGPIRIRGDGTAVRSYLYMADLAVWLWTLALAGGARGAYNVGSPHAITMLDLAKVVADTCAPDAEIIVEHTPDPSRGANRYVPATGRAAHELALVERVGLTDAVRRTVEWHRQSARG
jgi:nucleoside-diphosphate-sugar epimerase